MTENLLRELEEDMKQEEWMSFWRTYGPRIAAVLGVTIFLAGGYFLWTWRQQVSLERHSAHYEKALRLLELKGPNAESQKLLTELSSSNGGYGLLARLQLFRLKCLTSGGSPEALDMAYSAGEALIDRARQDLSSGIEGMAVLSLAALHLNHQKPLPPSLVNKLNALNTPQSPWRNLGLELQALDKLVTLPAQDARGFCLSLLKGREISPESQMRLVLALMGKGLSFNS